MLSRFDCYELCVQSPRHIVAFLRGVHGNEPIVLGEDFCGTAAIARRWCAEAARHNNAGRAVAIDLDPEVIERARVGVIADGTGDRVELRCGNCIAGAGAGEGREKSPLARARGSDGNAGDSRGDGCDVLFVGNFSIGYCHDRPTLLAYLRRCRERIARGNGGFGGGVFACDIYGGSSAFKLGGFERRHPGRGREIIRYAWSHDAADPITGMVENSIGFRVEVDGEIVQELPRAFTYRWRLWSIAELREAMFEAGFSDAEVYKDVNIAPGQRPVPVRDAAELGEDWIVLVVAR
jgi:hypothetical protein